MDKEPTQTTKKGVYLSPWALLCLIVSLVVLSGAVGYHLNSRTPVTQTSPSQSESSQSGAVSQEPNSSFATTQLPEAFVTQLDKTYAIIQNNYVGDIDSQKLLEGALTGMVGALEDPYTEYLNAEATEAMNSALESSFEGIGATVEQRNGKTVIVSPIDNAPAYKAGLQPDDIILKIGDQDISGWTSTQAIKLIRGPKGTPVTLTIQRGDSQFEVTIIRDTIPLNTVTSKQDETHPEIGYVRIASFSENTLTELTEQVEALRAKGAKAFVIDVRSNPGGLLDQALKISNLFVQNGSVIMKTQEKNQEPHDYVAGLQYGIQKISEPVVLLQDNGSASASEILAAALKESTSIPIVGTTSYGKGTVQTIQPVTDDTTVKVTMAKWLTPSGTWIHQEGLAPTVEVAQPEYHNLLLVDATAMYQTGSVSAEVKNIQEMLVALGYAVTPNGSFDQATVDAVKAFEKNAGLSETGVVTGDVANALNTQLRDLIKANDVQYQRAVELVRQAIQ